MFRLDKPARCLRRRRRRRWRLPQLPRSNRLALIQLIKTSRRHLMRSNMPRRMLNRMFAQRFDASLFYIIIIISFQDCFYAFIFFHVKMTSFSNNNYPNNRLLLIVCS